jgi:hypothetical protein
MTCILCCQPRQASTRGRHPTGDICWRCRRTARRYLDLPRSAVLRLRAAADRRGDRLLLARIDAALDPRFTGELGE